MSPRPDDAARQQLHSRLQAAITRRDKQLARAEQLKAAAETEFWQTLGRLKTAYHGAQADIAAGTGYSRDHVAKQIKKASTRAKDPAGRTGKPSPHPSPPEGKPPGKPRPIPMSQDPTSRERTPR